MDFLEHMTLLDNPLVLLGLPCRWCGRLGDRYIDDSDDPTVPICEQCERHLTWLDGTGWVPRFNPHEAEDIPCRWCGRLGAHYLIDSTDPAVPLCEQCDRQCETYAALVDILCGFLEGDILWNVAGCL